MKLWPLFLIRSRALMLPSQSGCGPKYLKTLSARRISSAKGNLLRLSSKLTPSPRSSSGDLRERGKPRSHELSRITRKQNFFNSLQFFLASKNFATLSKRQTQPENLTVSEVFFSLMKFIAGIKRSRTHFCRTLKTARLRSSVQLRKTLRLKSSARFFLEPKFM